MNNYVNIYISKGCCRGASLEEWEVAPIVGTNQANLFLNFRVELTLPVVKKMVILR